MENKIIMLPLDERQIINDINSIDSRGRKRNKKICKICNREFYPIESNSSRYSNCMNCYIQRECPNCGKKYKVSDINNNGFCSISCNKQYEAKNNIGSFSEEAKKKRYENMLERNFFSAENQKERAIIANKVLKESNKGLYNKEFCIKVGNIGREKQKELRINVWDNDFQKEMSYRAAKKRKEDPELKNKFRIIAINNLKDYLGKNNWKMKYCEKCNINTMHLFGKCYNCNKWLVNNFDRDKFYKERLEIIKFNSLDKNIKLSDIDSLKGVPGVWAKFTESGECLDVAQTNDIGEEMLFSLRAFEQNKEKNNEELKQDSRIGIRKKYRDMYNYSNGNIIFKIISINVNDKFKREQIEAQYAHDNKAIYWSPAPGQNI